MSSLLGLDTRRDADCLLETEVPVCPCSLSRLLLDGFLEEFLLLGWKKIPAVCPSGLCMTKPDDGEFPSFWAFAEKYSTLSGSARGDGGKVEVRPPGPSKDITERSELVREVWGRVEFLPKADCAWGGVAPVLLP